MSRALIAYAALLASACATKVELSTSDLSKRYGIDNVKASWGTTLSVMDKDIKVDLVYDMKAKKDFPKEATISGACNAVSYALTQNFVSGASKLALSTKQAGVAFKSVLTSKVSEFKTSSKIDSITAVKTASLAGIDVVVEPSFAPMGMIGKLTTKAGYGMAGVKLSTELTATTDGDVQVDADISYKTELDGRPISAVVKPLAKAAKIEVADEQVGVATATYTLGGEPKVTVKRAFSF